MVWYCRRPWLRSGTIRDNIVMGKPDATEEEVIAAAKASHAHSFIKRLPNGYDTVIAEDGGNLSQGQKQLLCITRVMLCLPPMLILDEATSSIDTRTRSGSRSICEDDAGQDELYRSAPSVHDPGGRCNPRDEGWKDYRAGKT